MGARPQRSRMARSNRRAAAASSPRLTATSPQKVAIANGSAPLLRRAAPSRPAARSPSPLRANTRAAAARWLSCWGSIRRHWASSCSASLPRLAWARLRASSQRGAAKEASSRNGWRSVAMAPSRRPIWSWQSPARNQPEGLSPLSSGSTRARASSGRPVASRCRIQPWREGPGGSRWGSQAAKLS